MNDQSETSSSISSQTGSHFARNRLSKLFLLILLLVIISFFGFYIYSQRGSQDNSSRCKPGYDSYYHPNGSGPCQKISSDAGKQCFSSSDCQNDCVVDSDAYKQFCPKGDPDYGLMCEGIYGYCSGIKKMGVIKILEKNKVQATLGGI